ncbi:MAG: HAMP domain-containing sensor histidine kinase [Desulfuromonadales bacterium]
MSRPSKLTDQELIEELKDRFDFNRKALQDLSALTKKLEEVNNKLQDSEGLKSHFLSNIRNEINNPLTSILGLSNQLMDGAMEPQKRIATASLIYSEAFTLDFQLRNIFMAAELEAGEALPAFSHVDIDNLVVSALDLFRHQAELKKITVVPSCPGDLYFTTDAQKLQIIVHNLLANAIEYTGEGGRVEVEAETRDGQLQIAVRDSGQGISKKDRKAIFDRFRQVEMGTTKTHRGHGLGLSIVGALADLLGGKVEMESSSSAGSTFILELPVGESFDNISTTAQDGNFFLFEETEKF